MNVPLFYLKPDLKNEYDKTSKDGFSVGYPIRKYYVPKIPRFEKVVAVKKQLSKLFELFKLSSLLKIISNDDVGSKVKTPCMIPFLASRLFQHVFGFV